MKSLRHCVFVQFFRLFHAFKQPHTSFRHFDTLMALLLRLARGLLGVRVPRIVLELVACCMSVQSFAGSSVGRALFIMAPAPALMP